MGKTTIQIRQRGALTLPAAIREKYRLEEGDALSIIDLDGVLVLAPKVLMLPKLAAEIERLRRESGAEMKDLLAGLPRGAGSRGRRRAKQ
jgi:AbrB family looped-hinge helix DNA binding protein